MRGTPLMICRFLRSRVPSMPACENVARGLHGPPDVHSATEQQDKSGHQDDEDHAEGQRVVGP